jgi:23S rRNA (cytidine1920-2'-O)/16S rRNA (cytidine1409-2'-O)-methyltransferase
VSAPDPSHSFVSRGGLKLQHALTTFNFSPAGLTCADLGANIGGFTDCLLQSGAAKVYAVDTGYGTLAWKLRTDPRVITLERSNALHLAPAAPGGVDLVVLDMGWTPQRLCIPAALRWLKPAPTSRIITLIKPHYEQAPAPHESRETVLTPEHAAEVAARVLAEMPALGATVLASTPSPIRGGASRGNKPGNTEWLALLSPSAPHT